MEQQEKINLNGKDFDRFAIVRDAICYYVFDRKEQKKVFVKEYDWPEDIHVAEQLCESFLEGLQSRRVKLEKKLCVITNVNKPDRLIDRIKAHRSSPDIYDPPAFEDMAGRIEDMAGRIEDMADHIEELKAANDKVYDEGFEAGQEYLKEELQGEGSY